MKPVMFQYATSQKDDDFGEVVYDYNRDINTINGKSVVDQSRFHIEYTTKTKVQRESDDTPNDPLLRAATKTDTKRETDDCSSDVLVRAMTKTNTVREADDVSIDPSLLLLTKTESNRESDE